MSTSALPVAASPMPGEAMLRVEGLGFRYEVGRLAALEGVSFEIMAGTITAILGPNGAGKTTLLHVLLGLRKAASGQIWLAGRSLGAYTRRELSQWMGLVPQSEYLPFDYSVLEYVVLGRAPYLGLLDLPGEEDARVAREALATVGVDGLAARPIPELSGIAVGAHRAGTGAAAAGFAVGRTLLPPGPEQSQRHAARDETIAQGRHDHPFQHARPRRGSSGSG